MPQKLRQGIPGPLQSAPGRDSLRRGVLSEPLGASPAPAVNNTTRFWLETIPQLGAFPSAPSGKAAWRNVRDHGAKADGMTDDTAAIQSAISDGGRCSVSDGASVYPATVYFPPGRYLVSSPILLCPNTEALGSPPDLPVLLAASSFVGLGVITSEHCPRSHQSHQEDHAPPSLQHAQLYNRYPLGTAGYRRSRHRLGRDPRHRRSENIAFLLLAPQENPQHHAAGLCITRCFSWRGY